ncbi:MAG: DUF72 domain-containing protein [Acidobacteriota bacterium]
MYPKGLFDSDDSSGEPPPSSRWPLRIGTCSFTAAGWRGPFYPRGLKDSEFLSHYATRFDTLEIDSTFYAIPDRRVVRKWYQTTPAAFRFALKFPSAITHEKVLEDCHGELTEFLGAAAELGEKLGPLLLQFPYFGRGAMPGDEFLRRLENFLEGVGPDFRLAVEVRNKSWIGPGLLDLLGRRGVALAHIDHPWMPPPDQIAALETPNPAFTYVRLLGDRKEIETRTTSWKELIVDRSRELRDWVRLCRATVRRGVETHVYVNNHYAGFAPATVSQFVELWDGKEADGT